MRSYCYIDRIEGKWAVCEVELLPIEQSKPEDFATKETEMMHIYLEEFNKSSEVANEGDIFVVEHDGVDITYIYQKDEAEKSRRLAVLKSIMG